MLPIGEAVVAAENASHMEDDDAAKSASGDAIFEWMRGINSRVIEFCRA